MNIAGEYISQIWTPDLYFVNQKDGEVHTITKPNINLKISPAGEVMFSQRLTLLLRGILTLLSNNSIV